MSLEDTLLPTEDREDTDLIPRSKPHWRRGQNAQSKKLAHRSSASLKKPQLQEIPENRQVGGSPAASRRTRQVPAAKKSPPGFRKLEDVPEMVQQRQHVRYEDLEVMKPAVKLEDSCLNNFENLQQTASTPASQSKDGKPRKQEAKMEVFDDKSVSGSSLTDTNPRFKTEICRNFKEKGSCLYGDECQFAHGNEDIRDINRQNKYKTKLCQKYWITGYCAYGPRCNFVHNETPAEKKENSQAGASSNVQPTSTDHVTAAPTFSQLIVPRYGSGRMGMYRKQGEIHWMDTWTAVLSL